MSVRRDYYEVLEVTRTATFEEIKKSFRVKARQCHPDVSNHPEAEAQFKELGEAYEVLSDNQKRQVYDAYGHDGLRGGGYQPSSDFMSGFPDLNDLFSQFFGGGFSGQGSGQRGGPARGEDLRLDVELEFMEAAFGVRKSIDVTHLIHCQICEGSGASPDSGGPQTCQTCQGQGQIRQTTQTIIGHFTQIAPCPRCQGQGTMVVDPCKGCGGKGRVKDVKSLDITVPAGVDAGTRLRVGSEGNAGMFQGPAGDLYVVLNVQPHSFFQRDGYELYASVPVTYSQLALGDELEVPLLEGTERIRLNPGTQSGAVFTLKQKGIAILNAPGQYGNYHVQVSLAVPKKLGPEERKLLEKLKELELERAQKDQISPSFVDRFKEVISGH